MDTEKMADTGEMLENAEVENEQTFTQSDIDTAVQRAKEQWEADRSQAERLSKMSEDERIRELNRTEREALEKERRAFEREKLEMSAAKLLKSKGIPEAFAARVCGADAEETKANIDTFELEWNAAVTAGVNERLKGKTPKNGFRPGGSSSLQAVIRENMKGAFYA